MDITVRSVYDLSIFGGGGLLLVAERLSLADVLKAWMRKQRLNLADLSRLSGLSRPTVTNARNGERVNAESVRLLSWALATDPYDGATDHALYRRILKDLAEAAEYPHLLVDFQPPPDIEAGIGTVTLNPASAVSWADFIRDHSDATPDQIKMLRVLWEALRREGITRLGDRE